MNEVEEKLVQLAWQTVKTKFRETDKANLDKKTIKGIPWSSLKYEAMEDNFDQTFQFAGYTQEEQQTVTKLITAQRNQGNMEPLVIPADYVYGLHEEEESKLTSEDLPVSVRECVTFENFAMLLNLINNVYIKNTIQASSSSQVIDEEEEDSEANARPYGYVDSFNRFMVSTQAEVDKIYQRFLPLMINKRKNQQLKARPGAAVNTIHRRNMNSAKPDIRSATGRHSAHGRQEA